MSSSISENLLSKGNIPYVYNYMNIRDLIPPNTPLTGKIVAFNILAHANMSVFLAFLSAGAANYFFDFNPSTVLVFGGHTMACYLYGVYQSVYLGLPDTVSTQIGLLHITELELVKISAEMDRFLPGSAEYNLLSDVLSRVLEDKKLLYESIKTAAIAENYLGYSLHIYNQDELLNAQIEQALRIYAQTIKLK